LPAGRLGLRKRGSIAEGWHADLVAFDPAKVLDTATYDAPQRFPVGISHVFVNGVTVVQDGLTTGARPGVVLRRSRDL
jgi:N-acyl-D-amino-acid deacylase